MKMKKIMFAVVCLIMIITIVNALAIDVNADFDFKDKISGMNTGANDSSNASTSAQNVVGAALNIARLVATGIALIMLAVLAMKYFVAAPGDRADIKKNAVVYVVGAIVLFASSALLGIIKDFADKNINS